MNVGHQEDKPSRFDIRRVRNPSWEGSIAAIYPLFPTTPKSYDLTLERFAWGIHITHSIIFLASYYNA
jgi:hypothetical protein